MPTIDCTHARFSSPVILMHSNTCTNISRMHTHCSLSLSTCFSCVSRHPPFSPPNAHSHTHFLSMCVLCSVFTQCAMRGFTQFSEQFVSQTRTNTLAQRRCVYNPAHDVERIATRIGTHYNRRACAFDRFAFASKSPPHSTSMGAVWVCSKL